MTESAQLSTHENTVTVTCGTYLTAEEVQDMQGHLLDALTDQITTVVFDLQETTSLDSSGIGLLIACHNSMQPEGGSVRVTNVSENIHNLLQLMRVTKRINVSRAEGAPHG